MEQDTKIQNHESPNCRAIGNHWPTTTPLLATVVLASFNHQTGAEDVHFASISSHLAPEDDAKDNHESDEYESTDDSEDNHKRDEY
ncbi:hypothetical protein CsSME_00036999 [Camellia sinensis var. sinensis]